MPKENTPSNDRSKKESSIEKCFNERRGEYLKHSDRSPKKNTIKYDTSSSEDDEFFKKKK